MPEIERSALLPFPADFMYRLVNDVASYPDFLPWCGAVEVHQEDEVSMDASILMKSVGINHWFRTRNRMQPGESIDIELIDGPFERLHGRWRFTPLDTQGSKIELKLEFEIRRSLAAAVIAPAFSRIANTMVDSFCRRAREIHET